MPKMTDSDYIALIEREENDAYGQLTGDLASERAKAIDWYLGKQTEELESVEDRSAVVDTVIADTIETILPALVKIFCSGEEVVKFEPVGPEDVDASDQETAYVNHVIEKADWLATFYAWAKDSLLAKNAYVYAWYDKREDVTEESYENLSPEEAIVILQDPVVEILESGQTEMGVSLKVRRKSDYGCIKVKPLPSEDVIVSTKHRSLNLQESPFVQIREMVTISSLREAGYTVADDISDDVGNGLTTQEEISRDQFQESRLREDEIGPLRQVLYRRTWIRADRDGDGIAELRRIHLVGRTILEDEPADIVPVACITPILMPHRHIGRSYADMMEQSQAIKSQLWRQALDNQVLANNGRHAVSDRVDLDDFLESKPGGAVRVSGDSVADAIEPLTHPTLGDVSLGMLRYADEVGQQKSGVNSYFSGTDANALNKTATGVTQLMGMAQERVLLIARLMAETGVKHLFLLVHALARKYSMREEIVRLRNKWFPIDPRNWRERRDMTVTVGLGTGNRTEMMAHLQGIINAQVQMLPVGLASKENLYNSLSELTKNAGFRDASRFWNDPAEQQQMQPPPPDLTIVQAQMQQQADVQKFQAQAQLEQLKEQNRKEIEKYKSDAEMMMAKYKADLDAQVRLMIAGITDKHEKARIMLEAHRLDTPAPEPAQTPEPGDNQDISDMEAMMAQHAEAMKPSAVRIVRDDAGKMIGTVIQYGDGSSRQVSVS